MLLANGWFQIEHGPLAKVKFDHAFINLEGPCDVETAYRLHCGEDKFEYIGKVVRWYYAVGVTGSLKYKAPNSKGNRNAVPNSEGAKPLMELPDEFPTDVDYDWYLNEANRILKDIGVM